MTAPKRKYTRLTTSQWAEIVAYWEAGDHTLAELSERYGVSQRAIQAQLRKRGSSKGSKAAEMAAVVRKEVFDAELGDQGSLAARAKEIRETTYRNATIIEGLIMAQLELAQKDPAQAAKAATALKALSLAASALEKLHETKCRAIGLDRNSVVGEELPILTIRDLRAEEIEELRKRDEVDELDDIGGLDAARPSDEADDIIVLGGEPEISAEEPEAGADDHPEKHIDAERAEAERRLGGRLVREALH